MDLSVRKYEFIQRLISVNEDMLKRLELVLEQDNIKISTLEDYNIDINLADLRIENGDFVSMEAVEKQAQKW